MVSMEVTLGRQRCLTLGLSLLHTSQCERGIRRGLIRLSLDTRRVCVSLVWTNPRYPEKCFDRRERIRISRGTLRVYV